MKQTKNFKYYLMIFVISTLAIFVFATIDAFNNDGYDKELLLTMSFAPISFTVFLFVFDKAFDMIFPKKNKGKSEIKDKYLNFLSMVNKEVEANVDFSIEDFRRLRDSERFQKSLKQAFRIFEEGETEDITYDYLSKKFKKDTNEHIAMQIVITELKKLEENS
jgi:hypothetical protein